MKRLLLFLIFAGIAAAQCGSAGRFGFIPQTGQWGCIPSMSPTFTGNVQISATCPAGSPGGSVCVGGAVINGSTVSVTSTAAPAAPVVTTHGVAGNVTIGYKVAFRLPTGLSAPSAETRIGTANATLNGSNYNVIQVPACALPFESVVIFVTTGGGNVPDTGPLVNVACGSTYNHQGLDANSGIAIPSADNTAGLYSINFGAEKDGTIRIGQGALTHRDIGPNNIAIGYESLYWCTECGDNIAVGFFSQAFNVAGLNNVSMGEGSLESTTGSNNTGVGDRVMENNASGSNNEGFGQAALFGNTTGGTNVGLGHWAGYLNNGDGNIFIGAYAGRRQTAATGMLIMDDLERASAAEEATNSILVGHMDARPENQTLRVNAAVTSPYAMHAPSIEQTIAGTCGSAVASNATNGAAVNGFGGAPSAGTCNAVASVSPNLGTLMTQACTLHNFYINSETVGGGAGDGVATVWLNNGSLAATALTCTIGTGSACHDTAHTAAINAGDIVYLKVATTGTSLSSLSVSVGCYR